jgi:16S rRNA (cytidine1402-2'-O)-methyltransferase
MAGRLFLIPTGLSEDATPQEVLPARVIAQVRALESFVVENAKSARAFLAACGHPRPIREIAMAELSEHTPETAVSGLLEPVRLGTDVGLVSEAGAPAVADPGARLVAAAHAEGIQVVPLVGPSAILLGLMASGLEGQRFRFHGYLPVNTEARRARLVEIERHSALHDETQAFIETPYRNDVMLADIVAVCHDGTQLAIAADLTGRAESVRLDRIAAWRAHPVSIGKRPAVFLLLAEAKRRPKTKR